MRSFALVAAPCLALVSPTLATAAPRADLQVRVVSSPSTQEAPGSRMTARATVLNTGDKRAPASRLGFYLSLDRRKSRGDFLLRSRARVSPRRPRSRASLLRTLTVPAGVPPGSYALVACADDTRRIRERRERNNCRSAARRIRIVTPVPAPLPRPVFPVPQPNPVVTIPSLRVTGLPNGTSTFDITPTYTGTAASGSSAIARIEVSVDGGAFTTTGVNCSGCGTASASWTFSPAPLGEGPHTFAFRAVDTANRPSSAITRTLTVDTTAPTFTSITATPGSPSVIATFSEPLACSTANPFDFTAEINNVAVAVNQAACSGSTVTLTLASAPAAGANVEVTLTEVISDPAGNVAPRPTTRSDGA